MKNIIPLIGAVVLLSACGLKEPSHGCTISLPDNGLVKDPQVDNQYILKLKVNPSCAHLKKNLERKVDEESEYLMARNNYDEVYKIISIKHSGLEYTYTLRFIEEKWAQK